MTVWSHKFSACHTVWDETSATRKKMQAGSYGALSLSLSRSHSLTLSGTNTHFICRSIVELPWLLCLISAATWWHFKRSFFTLLPFVWFIVVHRSGQTFYQNLDCTPPLVTREPDLSSVDVSHNLVPTFLIEDQGFLHVSLTVIVFVLWQPKVAQSVGALTRLSRLMTSDMVRTQRLCMHTVYYIFVHSLL